MKTDIAESSPAHVRLDVEAERELARLKNGFVNTLVHDVRLPLASILALLEHFDSKLNARESFDVEDRELLLSVVAQGMSLRRLIDDLLEVTQQQERPLQLKLEPVETGALHAELAESFRGEAALRGVEIKVQTHAGTPSLTADVRQLRRAICSFNLRN